MATVLVTGATGTLGRAVARLLLAAGHTVRALSRRAQVSLPVGAELITGDLTESADLTQALIAVDTVIHCATDPKHAQVADVGGTRQLLAAARERAPHLIYPSIVGIDRSAYPYYQAKLAAEALIEQGPLPWSILRATQFHDFVAGLLQSFGVDTGNEIIIPDGMRFQSVAVREVAAQLVSFVERGPVGRDADMGGPEILTFEEMAAAYLRIRGRSATTRSANLSGALYVAFRSGVNLTPDHTQGVVTWDVWLRSRFPPNAVG
ncbi:MAG TPA: NAD(P)H-binding protein [Ktedonobacterales bacterium]|jgi:uncharacterized protein YbjT (DUF2867 family)